MSLILLIDDDPLFRQTVRRILKSGGHAVVEAADGRAGLQAFAARQPDLVITDIVMPDKEGLETILDIRRMNPRTRVIAMSGSGKAAGSFLEIAGKFGAAATLAKPFRAEELLRCVDRVLGGA